MMEIVELPIESVVAAEWNPNEMDEVMRSHLRRSVERFGLVVPPIVREMDDGRFETIGGAQRLAVLKETGATTVMCVVARGDDVDARLLSQALNHIAGDDNLGLRAELIRYLLEELPEREVLSVLPDSVDALRALASLGQETMAAYLEAWQSAQAARLRHFQVQLTDGQLEVVEEAVSRFLAGVAAGDEGNPNRRGLALYRLCRAYLERVATQE